MNAQRKTLGFIGIAFLGATALFGQRVETDYDRAADYSQSKTYAREKVPTQDPLWVDQAVNSDLAAKGWTQVQSGGSVAIVATEMTRNQNSLDTFYNGFGDAKTNARSGEDRRATPSPVSPTQTSKTSTKA
jgi:hypothetical protein